MNFYTGTAPKSYRTARFASRKRPIEVYATDESRKITGNITITTDATILEDGSVTVLEGTVPHWGAHLLALDSRIENLKSEPMTLHYSDGVTSGRYHPDLLVTFKPGTTGTYPSTVLYEFKMHQFLRVNLSKWRLRMYAAHTYCLTKGWAFRVITERRILRYFAACSFLVPYLSYEIDPELKLDLIKAIEANPGASVWDLLESFSGRKMQALAAVWTLLARGMVETDLAKPLSNRTQIYPASSLPCERVL